MIFAKAFIASEKDKTSAFLRGAEWLTRHQHENHIISSGSNRRMKQLLFSLGALRQPI
jgi:hypothetical protein